MCVQAYVFVSVCACMHAPMGTGAWGVWKRMLDILELEVIVSCSTWVLTTKSQSSASSKWPEPLDHLSSPISPQSFGTLVFLRKIKMET